MKQSLATPIPRREFLHTTAGLPAAAAVTPFAAPIISRAAESIPGSPTIGIQVGTVSFVDEGTEKLLDLLKERGAVDTLFIAAFTYGRGLAGRQIPGQPFPDHG